jgi:integrase
MPRTLTALAVQNSRPRRRGGTPILTEISDGGYRGLRLVLHSTGARSWIVRYRYHGKSRKLTLGPVLVTRPGDTDPGNGLTLHAARRAASDALHRLAQGYDPGAEKVTVQRQQRLATADTFEAVARRYYARMAREKNLSTGARQMQDLERAVFPEWGGRPIAAIKRSDVVRLLDTISEQRGPTAADSALALIGKVMRDHAQRTDDYVPSVVPGMRRTKTKERARERVLNDDELRAIWAAAGEGVFGAFVKYLLLTACRRNEAALMPWSEIGTANGNGMVRDCGSIIWTLPAERNKKTKPPRPLVRPLSGAALAVIAGIKHRADSDMVFVEEGERGRRVASNFGGLKKQFDQRCGIRGWRLHDLRRTARSLMSRAGVNADHAERCLGHVIGGVRGTYDRYEYFEEKRHAFEALAALIETITAPQGEKIIPMRR